MRNILKLVVSLSFTSSLLLIISTPSYAATASVTCTPANQTHFFTQSYFNYYFTCPSPNPSIPADAIIESTSVNFAFNPADNYYGGNFFDESTNCVAQVNTTNQADISLSGCSLSPEIINNGLHGRYEAVLTVADLQYHTYTAPTYTFTYTTPDPIGTTMTINNTEWAVQDNANHYHVYLTTNLPPLPPLASRECMLINVNTGVNPLNRAFPLENDRCTFYAPPSGDYYILLLEYAPQQATHRTVVAHTNTFTISPLPSVVFPLQGAQLIFEGETYKEVQRTFIPFGSTDWTVTVDYGDGTGIQGIPYSAPDFGYFELNHVYQNAGDFTVTVSVTDNNNLVGTSTGTVHVEDPDNITPAPLTIDHVEYNNPSQGGSANCPEINNFSYPQPCNNVQIYTHEDLNYPDWNGDNSCTLVSNNTEFEIVRGQTNGTFCEIIAYTWEPDTDYTFSLVVKDGSHIIAQSQPFTFNFPSNLYAPPFLDSAPPQLRLNGNPSINDAGEYTQKGDFLDPDSTSWTATVDYGDGTGAQALSLNANNKTFTVNHVYTQNGTYTVTVTLTDDENITNSINYQTVEVDLNEAPDINPLSGATINPGDNYAENGSFDDKDSLYWSATVNYGDGSGTQPVTPDAINFSLNHQYSIAGTYTVTLAVTDNQGATSTETATVTVGGNSDPVTLYPTADTFLKEGSPNQNEGSSTLMRLQSSGHNRAMIKFDQSQIAAAVNGAQNYTAKLQFTISDNGNNWGSSGRVLNLHRMTQDWTEGNGFIENNNPIDKGTGNGTTWNCATDANISNGAANCSGADDWNMSNSSLWPFASAVTAATTITNNQSGVVEFDVTADVQSYISGTNQNYGWLLKKENEGQNGRVEFGTKESGNTPVLVITFN